VSVWESTVSSKWQTWQRYTMPAIGGMSRAACTIAVLHAGHFHFITGGAEFYRNEESEEIRHL
jgi:hypothetical protein